jgi:hypothetical protein
MTSQQRLLLELGRNFIAIPIRKHQEALCSLARPGRARRRALNHACSSRLFSRALPTMVARASPT